MLFPLLLALVLACSAAASLCARVGTAKSWKIGCFLWYKFFKNLRASLGKGDAEANPPKTKDQRRGATLEEEEEEEEFIRIQRIL